MLCGEVPALAVKPYLLCMLLVLVSGKKVKPNRGTELFTIAPKNIHQTVHWLSGSSFLLTFKPFRKALF